MEYDISYLEERISKLAQMIKHYPKMPSAKRDFYRNAYNRAKQERENRIKDLQLLIKDYELELEVKEYFNPTNTYKLTKIK